MYFDFGNVLEAGISSVIYVSAILFLIRFLLLLDLSQRRSGHRPPGSWPLAAIGPVDGGGNERA